MAKKRLSNFAFIDAQNLNLGIRQLGWKLDFRRFRIYLTEKYQVVKAYLFIGYLPGNQGLYKVLQDYDYTLIFKPILKTKDGKVKGNVDAELVLQTMIDYDQYRQAVIVTSDGDFYCLVNYLVSKDKLKLVISPDQNRCSALLKIAAGNKIVFMNNLEGKLAHKMKGHR